MERFRSLAQDLLKNLKKYKPHCDFMIIEIRWDNIVKGTIFWSSDMFGPFEAKFDENLNIIEFKTE